LQADIKARIKDLSDELDTARRGGCEKRTFVGRPS
jgi:hypothetical protein